MLEHKPIDKPAWTLIQDRKILFVRAQGKTVFLSPGGKREGDETDEQAITREVKEELNVDLLPGTFVYDITLSAQAAGKPDGVMVVVKCYRADYQGELTPSSEIEELAWFTSADMERTSATGKLILHYYKDQGLID